ncbi:MAG TPA: hypothetical protein VIT45_11650 [Allosphingosinicella sp.]
MTTERSGDECVTVIGGHRFSNAQRNDLSRYLASVGNRRIFLSWDETSSYRCIGAAIFMLQKSGVTFRVPQPRGE